MIAFLFKTYIFLFSLESGVFRRLSKIDTSLIAMVSFVIWAKTLLPNTANTSVNFFILLNLCSFSLTAANVVSFRTIKIYQFLVNE